MEIANEIRDFCDDIGVEPVVARSFGSRMMNLDGPNSDVDILVVFKRPAWQHVSPQGRSETYERSSGEREYQLWDVKKLFELASQSNPTAVEFLNSPITFLEPDEYAQQLVEVRDHLNQTFTPIALYYHYANLAINNYEKYIERSVHYDGTRYRVLSDVGGSWIVEGGRGEKEINKNTKYEESSLDRTVKRNLYIARGIVYARHVLETHEVPTMDFPQFVSTLIEGDLGLDDEMIEQIRSLVSDKRHGRGYDECGNVVKELVWEERGRDPNPEEHATRSPDDYVLDDITHRLYDG